jgi:DNA mismatch endonuclease (patch repair protein)
MDTLTKEARSILMSKIRSKDTRPELTVRNILHKVGYRYRLHRKDLPGKPDLVFVGLKKVINVNGCFWHGHKCPAGRIPKSNVDFWTKKIQTNQERDVRNLRKLNRLGWSVKTIWECQTKNRIKLSKRLLHFLTS